MFYSRNHRKRVICTDRQIQLGLCNVSSSHQLLSSSSSTGQGDHQLYPRQNSDAILYASMVAIFYAAIILIVVGSNCHRFRRSQQQNLRPSQRSSQKLMTVTDSKSNIFHIVLKGHRKGQPILTNSQPIAIV